MDKQGRLAVDTPVFSAVGLLVAATLCVLAGLIELERARRLVRIGKPARARLVPGKVREGDEDDGEPLPMLRFRTEDGVEIDLDEPIRAKGDEARLGAEVDVVYDPNNPRSARRKAFTQLWTPGLSWLAFALILAVTAALSQLFAAAPGAALAPRGADVSWAPKSVAPAGVKIVFIEQDS